MSKPMIYEREEESNILKNSATNVFIPSEFKLLRDSFDSQHPASSTSLQKTPPPCDSTQPLLRQHNQRSHLAAYISQIRQKASHFNLMPAQQSIREADPEPCIDQAPSSSDSLKILVRNVRDTFLMDQLQEGVSSVSRNLLGVGHAITAQDARMVAKRNYQSVIKFKRVYTTLRTETERIRSLLRLKDRQAMLCQK